MLPEPIQTMITTKTREQIEAEKASKPRPDLLPPRALALVLSRSACVSGAFDALAAYMKTRRLDALGDALELVLDACVAEGYAETPAGVLIQVGEIMGGGLRKHGPCTWRIAGTEQADPQCHYASLVRHLLEHCAGIAKDPDSGRPPLLHAVCQLSILINLLDDPPTTHGANDGRAMIGGV